MAAITPPKGCLQRLEQKLSSIKKVLSSPKVKKVALEVLKGLVSVIIGGGLGALMLSPLGTVFIIVGASVGAGVAGIAYGIATGTLIGVKKNGYPAYAFRTSPPLSVEQWLTDENQAIFKEVFTQKIAPQPWFDAWKQLKKLKSASSLRSHLWRRIQKGVSHGEAQILVKKVKAKPSEASKVLLKKISAETLYHQQILEMIWSDFKRANHEPELTAIAPLVHAISGVQEEPSLTFELDKFGDEQTFRVALEPLIQQAAAGTPLMMTMRLEGGNDAHTLFIQMAPKLRFYDSYSVRFTGFHEGFNDMNAFIAALFSHLKGYYSRFRPGSLHFQRAVIRPYI